MQLLGLYLNDMPKAVSKVLHKGWYPFGAYKRPLASKLVVVDDVMRNAHRVYQQEGLPQISVNCIIGMNGAGKSSLLDIIYRIINNFSVRMLGNRKLETKGRELSYAHGVDADLYYISEGKQYRISCRKNRLYWFVQNEDGNSFEHVSIKNANDPKPLLRDFFYTISTNYSLYAFNKEEYIPDNLVEKIGDNAINGEWLDGLFHKNDGYFTPIVITPYRNNGNIDIEKENRLAAQRVMALSLLAKAQGRSFIERYEPSTITYYFDQGYKERTESNYRSYIFSKYKNIDVALLIREFERIWEKILLTTYNDDIAEKSRDRYEMALFYLAYKTVKICFTYEDYWKALKLNLLTKMESTNEVYQHITDGTFRKVAGSVVSKLMREINDSVKNRSHITLKISICLDYVENIFNHKVVWGMTNELNVADMMTDKHIETFNDAIAMLPPAFYVTNMKFKEVGIRFNVNNHPESNWTLTGKADFSLEKMSSGERQMLYSLSYVLYHIKNIQSVKEDENRVGYHNICLIFDEVELYYHPDYQRRFLGMLFDAMKWCHIDTNIIHSIQILMVTHSPFVLTDMLTQNTLYLKGGDIQNVKIQTFAANYYELLNKSFFFDKSAIGTVASNVVSKMIQRKNHGELIVNDDIDLVGDDFIRDYLKGANL